MSFAYEGRPSDLRVEAGSIDQSGSYVFEVSASLEQPSPSKTICYWSLDGDNDSMISVWNWKDTAQDFILTFHYSRGEYRLPIHLEAGQAYNLDMMTLVHSKAPGLDGNVIPSNITSGSATLAAKSGAGDRFSAASTASVYNVRNATCGGTCMACNGVTEVNVDPDSYTFAVKQNMQAGVVAMWNTGQQEPVGSGTWSTTASNIATVGSTTGMLTGVSPGESGAVFDYTDAPIATTICTDSIPCPSAAVEGGGGATVTASLQVTNVAPAPCVAGTSGPMAIAGSGFS